jgi:glucose-6-phosphate isomerase
MYREAEKLGNIRYDITRILSLDLCGEKNKTFGHVHPKSSSNVEWPEIYEVLSGKAHFLLQKSPFGEVEEALLLYAKKGDCVIIPPGFGHVTINAGKGDLVLANLVSCRFEADYSLFAKLKGGCIYEMADGTLVKNENYKGDFEAKKSKADEFSAQFKVFEPFSEGKIIEVARKSREKIEFLDRPQLFC